jgi:SAM-dependent methyltransferase
MGDWNQIDFVRRHRDRFDGPVLEIGSRDYGSTPNIRPLFPDTDYVGIDMLDGPGVDLTLDLTLDFEEIDEALGRRRFGAIFCLSVLEHCQNPWAMCQNIARLLKPGGAMYLSVPWAWEFHGYPSDYWRFTPEGVRVLFPDLSFPAELSRLHTPIDGDELPIDDDLGAIRFSTRTALDGGHPLRVVSIGILRAIKSIGLFRWLLRHRYVMPPLMVDMVGLRAADGDA